MRSKWHLRYVSQEGLRKRVSDSHPVYAPHTAMDSVWGGINDWLASALEVDNKKPSVKLINSNPATDSLGGLGRIAELHEPLPLSKLQELIRSHLKLSPGALQVAYGSTEGSERLIKTVAMCAGGGASVLKGVDADLYWTGEMAHVRASSIHCPLPLVDSIAARRSCGCGCRA
jgi:putative NIF3 family GTP cyclohydrolase 1 type 2